MPCAKSIWGRADQNILIGATISGTSPATSYSVSDLIGFNPAARILFSSGSATITFTSTSAKTGKIAVLPVSNLSTSSGIATITNAAGLSVSFPIPARPPHNIPLTAILDFSTQANLSSTQWSLVLSGNPLNVLLGGGFGIYSNTSGLSDRDYANDAGWTERERDFVIEHSNEYGVRLRYPLQTIERSFEFMVKASTGDMDGLRTWHRANLGRPGVFWPDPTVNDAYYGTWDGFEVRRTMIPGYNEVTLPFLELVKGKPVA